MSNHRDEEEEEEEEEECFHDSLDRLVSSSSASCSASNSDYDDSESSPPISSSSHEEPNRRRHPFPVPRFPMGASRFDLWISEPAPVSERRSKLLTEMGLAREPAPHSRLKPGPKETDISRSISCNQLVRRDHGDYCSETVGGGSASSFVVRSKSDVSTSQCGDRNRLYPPPPGNSCSCLEDSKLSHSEIGLASCNAGTDLTDPLRLQESSDCVLRGSSENEEVEGCNWNAIF